MEDRHPGANRPDERGGRTAMTTAAGQPMPSPVTEPESRGALGCPHALLGSLRRRCDDQGCRARSETNRPALTSRGRRCDDRVRPLRRQSYGGYALFADPALDRGAGGNRRAHLDDGGSRRLPAWTRPPPSPGRQLARRRFPHRGRRPLSFRLLARSWSQRLVCRWACSAKNAERQAPSRTVLWRHGQRHSAPAELT